MLQVDPESNRKELIPMGCSANKWIRFIRYVRLKNIFGGARIAGVW